MLHWRYFRPMFTGLTTVGSDSNTLTSDSITLTVALPLFLYMNLTPCLLLLGAFKFGKLKWGFVHAQTRDRSTT